MSILNEITKEMFKEYKDVQESGQFLSLLTFQPEI